MSQNLDALDLLLKSPPSGAPPTPAPISRKDKVFQKADEIGVPRDLVDRLVTTESRWNHHDSAGRVLRSPKNAMGLFQVVPDRGTMRTIGGRQYDLNDEDQNTEAGLRYIKEGLDKSGGDPHLASLYYFGGPGALAKAQKTGRIPNISDGGNTASSYVKSVGGSSRPTPTVKPLAASPAQPDALDLLFQSPPQQPVATAAGLGTDSAEAKVLIPDKHAPGGQIRVKAATARAVGALSPTGLQTTPDPNSAVAAQNPNEISVPGAKPPDQPGPVTGVPPVIPKEALIQPESDSLTVQQPVLPPPTYNEQDKRYTGNVGRIMESGPAAVGAYTQFLQRNVPHVKGKAVAADSLVDNEPLATVFTNLQDYFTQNPKAKPKEQARAIAQMGKDWLADPNTDGMQMPTILHQAMLSAHWTPEEIQSLPSALRSQIQQRQAQARTVRRASAPGPRFKVAPDAGGDFMAGAGGGTEGVLPETGSAPSLAGIMPGAEARIAKETRQADRNAPSGVGGLRKIDDPQVQFMQTLEREKNRTVFPGDPSTPARLKAAGMKQDDIAEFQHQQKEAQKAAQASALIDFAFQQSSVTQIVNVLPKDAKTWVEETFAKGGSQMLSTAAGLIKNGVPSIAVARAFGAPDPVLKPASRALAYTAGVMNDATASMDKTSGRSEASQEIQDLAAGTLGSAPAMALIALGVPAWAAFGMQSSAQAQGADKKFSDIVHDTAKGATIGALFDLPLPAKMSLLTRLGARVSSVGAGTFGIEKLDGASTKDAFHAAAINAILSGAGEGTGILKKGAETVARAEVTPEWLRDKVAKAGGLDRAVVLDTDGRAISMYADPKTQGMGGEEISAEKADKYAKRGAEDMPVLRVTPEEYDQVKDLIKSKAPKPGEKITKTITGETEAQDAGEKPIQPEGRPEDSAHQGLVSEQQPIAGADSAESLRPRPSAEESAQGQTIASVQSEAPVEGFTTSKGSTYEVAGEGTKRFKAATGKQYGVSKQTVYVAPQIAMDIQSAMQSTSFETGKPDGAILRNKNDGQLYVADRAKDGSIIGTPTLLKYETAPKVGLHPIEIGGKVGIHVGHPITEVRMSPAGLQPEEPTGQRSLVEASSEEKPVSVEPKAVIEAAGMQYLGEQQMPKGKPSQHVFNDPQTGSTLMMPAGEVTPEGVKAKVEASRAKLAEPKPAPDALDSLLAGAGKEAVNKTGQKEPIALRDTQVKQKEDVTHGRQTKEVQSISPAADASNKEAAGTAGPAPDAIAKRSGVRQAGGESGATGQSSGGTDESGKEEKASRPKDVNQTSPAFQEWWEKQGPRGRDAIRAYLETGSTGQAVGAWKDAASGVKMNDKAIKAAVNNLVEETNRRLSSEAGAVNFGEIYGVVSNLIQRARDQLTIDPVPGLKRLGVSAEARQHAAARVAVPYVVRDLLSKVFPDEYADPEAMALTMDMLNKDNILGGYDTFLKNAREASAGQDTDMAQFWQDRADAVGDAQDIERLEEDVAAAKENPQIMANIDRWVEHVNPEIDRMYNEMKRVDPDTPREGRGREFGARVNLLPEARAAEMKNFADLSQPMPEGVSSNYRNPNVKKDKFMKLARFTGQYSTDAEAVLTNVIGPRWNEVTKLRLYDALTESGAAVELDYGETPPTEIQDHKAVRLPIKVPETGEGGLTRMVEKALYVRADIARELRDVLNTDMPLPQNKMARWLTTIQLAQLTDMTAHLKNIHTVLAAAPGTRSAFTDAMRRLPILGSVDSIARIINVTRGIISDTPASRAEQASMARLGLLRPEYPLTGLQKITRGQQVIHHVDTASRIVMNRFFDNLVAAGRVVDSEENRASFVQQIGEYNRRLMGPIMRAARDAGFAPFVVAGRNYNRQARRLLTGNPGVEASTLGEASKMRLVNILAGLVAASVLPALLNLLSTGNMGGRPGTPIGAWDLGYDPDEQGRHRVIDLMQIVGIRRGLRGTGANAVIEGIREGQTWDEIIGHAGQDVTSTLSHPWMGPALGFAYQTITGKRLDLRGGPEAPEALNVGGGGKQYTENARTALENQNPLLAGVLSPLTDPYESEDSYPERIGKGLIKGPESAFGVYDLQSPAQKVLSEDRRRRGAFSKTADQMQARELKSKLHEDERAGKNISAELDQAVTDGKLTLRQAHDFKANSGMTPLAMQIKYASLEASVRAFEVMDDKQKGETRTTMALKLEGAKPEFFTDAMRSRLQTDGFTIPDKIGSKRKESEQRRETQKARKEKKVEKRWLPPESRTAPSPHRRYQVTPR